MTDANYPADLARVCGRAPAARALSVEEIQLNRGVDIEAACAVACVRVHVSIWILQDMLKSGTTARAFAA